MELIADGRTQHTLAQLKTFLFRMAELRQAATPVSRLESFLRHSRPTLRALSVPEVPSHHRLPPEKLKRILSELAKPLAEKRDRGDAFDIWQIAGLDRNEVRTAKVLTWILDPHGSHGAADAYLQAVWTEIRGAERLNFSLTEPQRTLRENYPLGNEENRVDVEVLGANFLLFVEVKIDADEGLNQVSRYCALAAAKAISLQRPHWAVLYLSQRPPENPVDRCLHFRWRDIAKAIRAVAEKRQSNDFATQLAIRFATHVARLH